MDGLKRAAKPLACPGLAVDLELVGLILSAHLLRQMPGIGIISEAWPL